MRLLDGGGLPALGLAAGGLPALGLAAGAPPTLGLAARAPLALGLAAAGGLRTRSASGGGSGKPPCRPPCRPLGPPGWVTVASRGPYGAGGPREPGRTTHAARVRCAPGRARARGASAAALSGC